MTTKIDIREWLEQGKKRGADYLIVVCDTFDWEDYPVFVSADKVHKSYEHYNSGSNMQKVMEVYDLHQDFEKQLNETCSMHLPPKR